MTVSIQDMLHRSVDSLQFKIVVKLATLLAIVVASRIQAGEIPVNIFVSSALTGQKIHLSKALSNSKDDSQIQLVVFDDESKRTVEESSSKAPQVLKASAGDDVLAYVGRRATLNGGLSQPEGRIGSRWIQISGPPILDAIAQGPNLIVVVPAPGTYQFLLVVAEGGTISEPDSVTLVAVEHPDDVARQKSKLAAPPEPVFEALVVPTVSDTSRDLLVRLTHKALANVPHSPGMAQSLSTLFADVSQKMNLYTNYAEAHQEISRRITDLIDAESVDIQGWNIHVFEPLTQALAIWVRPAGLDLMDKSQWVQPFTPIARSAMTEGLSAISEGFLERTVTKKSAANSLEGKCSESVTTKDRGQPMIRH